jgi:hypothetical protein
MSFIWSKGHTLMKHPIIFRAKHIFCFGFACSIFLQCVLLSGGGIVFGADTQAGRKSLHGHVPALIARLNPFGRLPADTNLTLAIGLPLRDQAGLTNFLRELDDPASTNFQHYLNSEQFTERYGPTENDYQSVVNFARRHGLTITATHPNRLVLDVNGSVQNIEKAFQIILAFYPHPTEPRNFHAPNVEPSVPANIPILDVSGLDDFQPPRPMDLRRPGPQGPKATRLTEKIMPQIEEDIVSFATGGGPGGDFIGADFRAAYAPGVTLTGVGQSVGLFEFGPYFTNDIVLYKQAAGLQDVVVTNVLLDGFSGIPPAGADDGEETLDIDMAMCMAPGATIIVYEGNSAIDIFNRIATDNKAKQIGCSFGFYPPPATMDNVFLQYAAQGQTLFAASGDSGAYSTNLIFAPADDPNITSVGGTSLTTTGPRGSWISESTWGGSGGGITTHYAIPSYQSGMDMTTNHGSTSQRNFPDVSMLADTVIFWYLKNGQSGTVGGTSAAAPLWAGFMALVNQQAAQNGRGPIGNLNSIIYGIGRTNSSYPSLLHDITAGNNFNTASPTNFPAVAGYDLATGWGSPGGSNLINFLAASTDTMQITPGTGFTITAPALVPFNPTNVTFSLTNAGVVPIAWSLANTSVWLTVSANTGVQAPLTNPTNIDVGLNLTTATNLSAGNYYAYMFITNVTSGAVQYRLFTLSVSTANLPVLVTGFNAGVVVPTNATPASQQATGFDIPNSYAFYQSGLNHNPQVTGSGGTQGLPADGLILSLLDGRTTFQLGNYGTTTNVLLMGDGKPNSGTLTFANPQSYNSLAVLASSANGGGTGTLIINFADGSSSSSFSFNAQDWFNNTANVAVRGFGRLQLTAGLSTENNGSVNPNMYQTTINLAVLGLNQPVSSIVFTKPVGGAGHTTGIFAVSGTLMPPQVVIAQQPQSVTNNNPAAGAVIKVGAMGAPPLSFQWYSGVPGAGSPVVGQTNASLTFIPVSTNQAGSYFVVVTNSINSVTSAPATLTVYAAPVIAQQPNPTNLFLAAGQTAHFSATVNGATPLAYSWRFNGTAIGGANSSAYNLANVQPANSGAYSLLASNAYGMATSSVVSLTVVPAPTYPYGQIVLSDAPIGYWRMDETNGSIAHDYVGGNNGIYTNVALNQAGDNLLDTHKAARFGSLASANSYVANIPIDFATGGSATFSIEAWVNGNAQTSDAGIITRGTGAGGEQFNLDCGSGGTHLFRFFVRDAGGGVHLANGNLGPNGTWRHLVGVCDEANGKVILYVNGISNASGTITAGSGLQSSANATTFGARQSGAASPYDLQFVGSMEEVAIYNVALTPAQVLRHYNAVSNRPPVFASNPFSEPSVIAGQFYSGSIATNASDPNGDTITFSKVGGPAWLNVAGNGALSGTPFSADVGTNSFLVNARDPSSLSSSATMNINVIAAPSITAAVTLQDMTNLVLSWSGGIAPYQVQIATNLTAPTWQSLGAPVAGNTLTLSPSNDAAFYRIMGQ